MGHFTGGGSGIAKATAFLLAQAGTTVVIVDCYQSACESAASAIVAQGGSAFGDYQVPLAILSLKQGLGRLLRHRQDRGVLAVLDPRLRSMGYGQRFLASLPPAPVTHRLIDVARFFESDAGERA